MLRQWSLEKDLPRCWDIYGQGTKLSEQDDNGDNCIGDDALLLGCYTLVKEYRITSIFKPYIRLILEQPKFLLQAAICLELGLSKSPYNFQFRLLLIRIYVFLGSNVAAKRF